MSELKVGDEYINIAYDFVVKVSQIHRKGRGFQVTYRQGGASYGLLASKTKFLRDFKLKQQ